MGLLPKSPLKFIYLYIYIYILNNVKTCIGQEFFYIECKGSYQPKIQIPVEMIFKKSVKACFIPKLK